ncbi:hypothetical protein [uncultured Maritimibacter sp.]|uniref:hypothetical protein n=1 Tax=uncultured Maritimibacter sp. TaxID=991866 RepID=UPI000B0CF3AB|nr:hypothetical protein [uncultured Maritimibacter sp.]
MIRALIKLLGGGLLDRVLDTVDAKVRSQTDAERIKGEIIRESYRHRADFMRAGGFWLMLIFALPLALWFAAVVIYSILWCAGCAYPKDWTIAALPPPFDEWAGMMIISIFGVITVSGWKR